MTRAPSFEDPLGDFTADTRVVTLAAMAALVGVISAFVALALVRLIGLFTNLAYFQGFDTSFTAPSANALGLWAVGVPVVGGVIVGVMARYGSEKIRGHGIPEALEAILIGQSRMSAKVAILKPLSSAISIGTGGPFGAEGPIIMTGGAFGSLFAQAFHLSPAERKTLLVAGALRVPLLGSRPLFPVTPHALPAWPELFAALGLGIVAGFGSEFLTWLVYASEDLFRKPPIIGCGGRCWAGR